MRVRYTPEAFADRKRIIEYLRERSPGGARSVAASIRDAVAQLGDHPLSGYRTDDPGVRVLFIVRYPYKIFYRVRETGRNLAHSPYVATGEALNVPVRENLERAKGIEPSS